ncbi:MAG: alpha/beta hydrolase [Phycisphaerales bacterium]|nr:alpha/beta hydrolase [Phycisphaerales bacterium]
MTRRSGLAAYLLLILAGVSAKAQHASSDTLSGTWEAQVQIADRCHLQFRLTHGGGPAFTGVLDAPQWKLTGPPIADGQISGNRISFKLPDIEATFSGSLNSAHSEIAGQWTQYGTSTALFLRKTAGANTYNRPQDPQPPHAYFHEDLTLLNPDSRLRIAGTVTIPEGGRRRPLIILLSEAGPHDREGTFAGHHPLLVLSDRLTRAGFATWRMDDRGVGESDGDLSKATIDDLAADVRFVIRALGKRDDIDASRVGIVAHGEGGWVAARAAADFASVRFLLLVNMPMLRGDESEFTRIRSSAANSGDFPRTAESEAEIQLLRDAAAMRDSIDAADRVAAVREAIMKAISRWSAEDRARLGDPDSYAAQLSARVCSAAMRDAWAFDPIAALMPLKCPILVLMGQRDAEVPVSAHAAAIRTLANGRRNITVREEPNWNHLLQYTRKLSVSEYGAIDETFAPEALEAIRSWCVEQGK